MNLYADTVDGLLESSEDQEDQIDTRDALIPEASQATIVPEAGEVPEEGEVIDGTDTRGTHNASMLDRHRSHQERTLGTHRSSHHKQLTSCV